MTNTTIRKRVTIADIAREAGVSKTAVSFAFNAPGRIGDETRRKILLVAEKLNYIPDPTARKFSRGVQMTLGFLLPQALDVCFANPYIIEVMRGLGAVAQEQGYMLTVIPPLNDSIGEAVKNATVDGLVTMGYLVADGVSGIVDVRAMPLVMIDGGNDGQHISVNIDDEEAAHLQLSQVLKRGHRRIAVLSLPAPSLTPKANDKGIVGRRMAGYKRALEEAGLGLDALRLFQGEATWQAGWDAAPAISRSGVTCLVTMSDIQAFGFLDWCQAHGIRIPDSISVVGFDDVKGDGAYGRLTTISQPAREKGIMAARLLFDILHGREPAGPPLVRHSFVEGGTLKDISDSI